MQTAILTAVAIISMLISGVSGFYSALLGGLCYLLPTILTVLLLNYLKPYSILAAKGFFFGEVLKVLLSLLMMLMVFVFWHQSLIFIPFLLGLVVVSHLVFLVFLKVQYYGN